MGPMTFIPGRLSLHSYLCLSLLGRWGIDTVLAFLAGGVCMDCYGAFLDSKAHSSCEERITGIQGLLAVPPPPLSIFTTTFLSSLDLPSVVSR